MPKAVGVGGAGGSQDCFLSVVALPFYLVLSGHHSPDASLTYCKHHIVLLLQQYYEHHGGSTDSLGCRFVHTSGNCFDSASSIAWVSSIYARRPVACYCELSCRLLELRFPSRSISDLYLWLTIFRQADITGLNKEVLPTLHVDPAIAKALAWGDYVSIGLWNACARHDRKDIHSIKCSEPSISYSFHPASVWSSWNGTAKMDVTLPQKVLNVVDAQSMNTMLIKILFIVGLGLSTACLVLGSIGACIGSKNRRPASKRRLLGFVALQSLLSTIVLLVGAGLATRGYTKLLDVMNPSFGEYINFTLGRSAMACVWLSMLFALLATAFWTQSWRKERTYRRLQGSRGQVVWAKNGVEIHIDAPPSVQTNDNNPLLEKDTAYHSPTRA